MKHVVIIDNFDSFTYNIKHYLEQLACCVSLYQNNAITVDDIAALKPTHILLSPGPGNPADAGITVPVIQRYQSIYPILGVCLGHQCIAAAHQASIVRANAVAHAKNSVIEHTGQGIFAGLPRQFSVTRYHSLMIDPDSLSDVFTVTAVTNDANVTERVIMGIQHKHFPLFGVQFHPEAVLSEQGLALFSNFLRY